MDVHSSMYLFLLSPTKQVTSLVPTTPTTAHLSTGQLLTTFPAILFAQHSLPSQPACMTSQALSIVYTTTHATLAPEMHSQGRPGHHSMHQHPEVVWGQHQMQQLAATQYQQQQQMSTRRRGLLAPPPPIPVPTAAPTELIAQ